MVIVESHDQHTVIFISWDLYIYIYCNPCIYALQNTYFGYIYICTY